MKQAIGLIVNKPNENYLDFLNKFTNYDIYIIIDDNSIDHGNIYCKQYSNLNFFQINNNICTSKGYINSSTMGLKKLVSGWDKALYLFNIFHLRNKYNYVWLFEDDVFFYNEKTIEDIDKKYPYYDLLANCDFQEGDLKTWVWSGLKINLSPPYYSGMVCASRLSNRLLQAINDYAMKNKKIFFVEAFLPTITKHYNLTYFQPSELTSVVYRCDWEKEKEKINKENIYHPIKEIKKHVEIRNIFTTK
jgi:hypothetical protein